MWDLSTPTSHQSSPLCCKADLTTRLAGNTLVCPFLLLLPTFASVAPDMQDQAFTRDTPELHFSLGGVVWEKPEVSWLFCDLLKSRSQIGMTRI